MSAQPEVNPHDPPLPAGQLKDGWFSEINDQWPGQALTLQVEEVLFNKKSEYQHIMVFKSKSFGNVLVLDGVIQYTELDEMAYQEMITHLPLFAHPNPKSVLIVGGGDGGVLREVVKHGCVEKITMVEIDQLVIDTAKNYFTSMAPAWTDSRLTLVCDDASKFIEKPELKETFDVIICDSSDPVGPAQVLFETPFYKAMFNALKPGGKICTQAESMWMHLPLIERLIRDSSAIFANAEYASTQIPTYPCGQIGLLVCSKEGGESEGTGRKPRAIPDGDDEKFRFYTTEMHKAAFVLPAFVNRALSKAREEGIQKKDACEPAAKRAKSQ